MTVEDPCFVSWEEHIICHERGNRMVHFFLKDTSGLLILAVIGTERSIRHMLYVVPDEFIQAYGSSISTSSCRKWRARREVVDWLTLLVSKHRSSLYGANLELNDQEQDLESLEVSMTRLNTELTYLRDQMVPRRLKVQNSDIKWSGVAWICSKQLKHYPSFYHHKTIINVHSFVFIMAEKESHYLGYLEDLYENKKGLKKVKVRWFHHSQEVKRLMPELNPHPNEVFMTSHVQAISAECVDGPATVLTTKHYEKYMTVISESSSSGVHMCFRQFKGNRVKPFTVTKMRGYTNQAILSCIADSVVPKQKAKSHKPFKEGKEEFTFGEPVNVGAKRNRSSRGIQGLERGYYGVRNLAPENPVPKCEPTYPKLRLKLSRKAMISQAVASQVRLPVSFKVDEKIELLCQDSGMRGCWFRCEVLQAAPMKLKVQYDDVQDVEGPANLVEWVCAYRVAAPDKLGMRCEGRRTIRPCPPEDSTGYTFEVGAAVDAWWSDGWWEGVVIKVDISINDTLQVYIPGEGIFITVQQKHVRTSKDWVDDRWITIKAKSDILSYLATRIRPSMAELSVSGGSPLLEHKPITLSELESIEEDERRLLDFAELESIEEDERRLLGFAESDNLAASVKGVDSEKQPCTSSAGDGIRNNNSSGNGINDNDDNGNDDVVACRDKLVSKERFESSELEM